MAWSLVGITLPAAANGGTVTFTEPSGVAAGDLLIASLAYRDNAANYTVPSGWTQLGFVNNSNTSQNSATGIASLLVVYQIRGASAPNLIFTRTGGNANMSALRAYRSSAGSPTLDVSATADALTNNASQSTPGITTTGTNRLIVVSIATGRNTLLSAIDAATDPATASGATNTATAPTAGTLIERSDVVTSLGADISMATADAIKSTAGATGNFTWTLVTAATSVSNIAAFAEPGGSTSQTLSGKTLTSSGALTKGTLVGVFLGTLDARTFTPATSLIKGELLGAQPGTNSILREDGFSILREDGEWMLREEASSDVSVTLSGKTLISSASLILGVLSGASVLSARTLVASGALTKGTFVGALQSTLDARTFTPSASLIKGTLVGALQNTLAGVTLAGNVTLVRGTLTGVANDTMDGAVLAATITVLRGTVTAVQQASLPARMLAVPGTLLAGTLIGAQPETDSILREDASAVLREDVDWLLREEAADSPVSDTLPGVTLTSSTSLIPGTMVGGLVLSARTLVVAASVSDKGALVGQLQNTLPARTLVASISLVPGTLVGQLQSTLPTRTLVASISLVPGTLVGQLQSTLPARTLSAAISLVPGTLVGQLQSTLPTRTLAVSISLVPGTLDGDVVLSARTLVASISLVPGTLVGQLQSTLPTRTLVVSISLVPGSLAGTAGANSGSLPGRTLVATSGLTKGTLTGMGQGALAGVTLTSNASLVRGTFTSMAQSTLAGVTLTSNASLVRGTLTGMRQGALAGVTLASNASLVRGTLTGSSVSDGAYMLREDGTPILRENDDYFLREEGSEAEVGDHILREDGTPVLRESGDYFLREESSLFVSSVGGARTLLAAVSLLRGALLGGNHHILAEDGFSILREDGEYLLQEFLQPAAPISEAKLLTATSSLIRGTLGGQQRVFPPARVLVASATLVRGLLTNVRNALPAGKVLVRATSIIKGTLSGAADDALLGEDSFSLLREDDGIILRERPEAASHVIAGKTLTRATSLIRGAVVLAAADSLLREDAADVVREDDSLILREALVGASVSQTLTGRVLARSATLIPGSLAASVTDVVLDEEGFAILREDDQFVLREYTAGVSVTVPGRILTATSEVFRGSIIVAYPPNPARLDATFASMAAEMLGFGSEGPDEEDEVAYEVGTGTNAGAMTGAEKLGVLQGGLPRTATMDQLQQRPVQNLSAGGTVLAGAGHVRLTTTTAGYSVILPAPRPEDGGRVLLMEMVARSGTSNVAIALSNVDGGSGINTVIFSAVGHKLLLVGGATKWTIIKEIGVTLN